MKFLRYISIFTAVLFFAVIGFLFLSPIERIQAEKSEFWVTMDADELKTVQADALRRGVELELEVKDVQGGVAVVETNTDMIEQLSTEMHKHYGKCSGFVAHQTEAEALVSLDQSFVADGTRNFGGYTIDNQADVSELISATQEIAIRNMIVDLSSFPNRRYNQPSGLESANFIKDTWTTIANGRDDISVEFFEHASNISPQPSVILTITGTETPDEVVVLGGHQDSIRSGSATALAPGADDDASGIASLTEAIRVMVLKNFRPKKTVKFMAYAAEEVGLRGSKNIAETYNNDGVNVVGVLQLDMTNFKGSPTVDFAFESDSRFINVPQTDFLKSLVDEYLPTLAYADSQCNYGCSDHASWHNNGFPASFPFEAPFGQHNNTIHSGNDKIDVSNGTATHAEKFTKLALTFVGELAKGDIPAAAPENRVRFDFDGDEKTDVSIFRPDVGQWWFINSGDSSTLGISFGLATDQLVPEDFTGDGKTDVALFRPSSSEWIILRSEDFSFFSFPFGTNGDIPAPGDFDGDGKADATVYRPSAGTWFTLRSTDLQLQATQFGIAEDKPVVADYDGDGTDDIAIFRPSNSQWWLNRSTDGTLGISFGSAGDKTVHGDYTGDGKDDVALFRPSTSEWIVLRSEDFSFFAFPLGTAGDIPTPGDYDGDGVFDATVFRPSTRTWFKQQTTNGFEAIPFGLSGDIPLPSVYVVE